MSLYLMLLFFLWEFFFWQSVHCFAHRAGKFAVSVRDNFLNVRFSTLGYREKTVFVKKGAENDLVIDLVPSDYVLKEVVVKPKKEKYSKKNNPAVEFVKKLI